jgi:lipopolysaccharide transport system ATP-binding protein
MSDSIISVQNLSKCYLLGHQGEKEKYTALRDVIARNVRGLARTTRDMLTGRQVVSGDEVEEFWALKDVSFEVKRGEVLGIIGRNGAGKSTLLKILSRITEPTMGRIEINGRVASLLEVGTGFHPELTGRENIFLNGAILGMTRAEIRKSFDEIVAFAEVEKFLDTPVKRYSSGMYVRLAFAVAAHLQPEILIVDEVLAVGDAQFQKKCMGKMQDVATGGRTVLFVSHNMSAVLTLCNSVICLEKGIVSYQGSTQDAVNFYLKYSLPSLIEQPLVSRTDRSGSGVVRITSFRVEDDQGMIISELLSGMNITFVIGYESKKYCDFYNIDPGISFHNEMGETVFIHYCSYAGYSLKVESPIGEIRFRVEHFPLNKGQYLVGCRLVVNGEEADWIREGLAFISVNHGNFYGAASTGCPESVSALINGKWTIKNEKNN